MYRRDRKRNKEREEEEAHVNETEASLEAIHGDEAGHDAEAVLGLVEPTL